MVDKKNEIPLPQKGMKEWRDFLIELEKELGVDVVQKWVPKLIRFDAANLYLEAEPFQTSWFEEHVEPRLGGLVNANHRPIKVHLLSEKKPQRQEEKTSIAFNPDPLDPEFSFQSFIPSEKNQIPLKLLEDPSPFNPIYFHGPKGAGKTHLLVAAAFAWQKMGKKVFFVRAETFTEHVVQAIRLGQMQLFRKTYREIDTLIIDDIHIFSKKGATQEEFFHTFNTLHTAGKQILVSANCPPSALKDVEPRLVSRFEWGISLEIGKSDLSKILKKKGECWKIPLSDMLIDWLVQNFPSDPILPLKALSFRAKNSPLSPELGIKLLQDFLEKEKQNAITPEKIIKTVAAHYGITAEDLLGKSQTKGVAQPRQVAMYFCREKLRLPYQKIGELFGRDHSTVMSSIKQIEKAAAEKTIDLLEF